MSSILRFPKANPIRIVLLDIEGRNANNIDYSLWHELSQPNIETFCQKFEKTDTIYFQFHSSFINNFVEVVNYYTGEVVASDFIEEQMLFEDGEQMLFEDGEQMLFEGSEDSLSDTVKVEATYSTHEAGIDLSTFTPGKYYIQVYGDHTDGKSYQARSEVIDIQVRHKNTVLFEYYNLEPAFDIDWRSTRGAATGTVFQFRLWADFIKLADSNEFENIRSSEGLITKVMDRFIERRILEFLELSPAWVVQKVNLILGHDTVTIDGASVVGYEKMDFNYEKEGVAWLKPSVTIAIKESDMFNRHDSGTRVLFS